MKLFRRNQPPPIPASMANPPMPGAEQPLAELTYVAVCSSTTAKGKPCKVPPELGTDRCIFHPRQAM